MTLQKKTLQRYRQLFPNETLKETSEKTGIQVTRVFRLFNGKTMKVVELEAFENAINKKIGSSPNFNSLNKALNEAAVILTNEELGRITEYVERRITLKAYSRSYIQTLNQDAHIA